MQSSRKEISAAISPESYAHLEEVIASGRASDLGGAVDLAVEEMRRAIRRERSEQAEPYSAEPSPEEVAEDRATMRAIRDRNPELLFDE